eukprot:gene3972-4225_t
MALSVVADLAAGQEPDGDTVEALFTPLTMEVEELGGGGPTFDQLVLRASEGRLPHDNVWQALSEDLTRLLAESVQWEPMARMYQVTRDTICQTHHLLLMLRRLPEMTPLEQMGFKERLRWQEFVSSVFTDICRRTAAGPGLTASQVAAAAVAAGHLGAPDTPCPFALVVQQQVHRNLQAFNVRQLADVLWGLAKSQPDQVDPQWVKEVWEMLLLKFKPVPDHTAATAKALFATSLLQFRPRRQQLLPFYSSSATHLTFFSPAQLSQLLLAVTDLALQPPADWINDRSGNLGLPNRADVPRHASGLEEPADALTWPSSGVDGGQTAASASLMSLAPEQLLSIACCLSQLLVAPADAAVADLLDQLWSAATEYLLSFEQDSSRLGVGHEPVDLTDIADIEAKAAERLGSGHWMFLLRSSLSELALFHTLEALAQLLRDHPHRAQLLQQPQTVHSGSLRQSWWWQQRRQHWEEQQKSQLEDDSAAATQETPPVTPANAAFAKVDDLRMLYEAKQKEITDAATSRPIPGSSWLYGNSGSILNINSSSRVHSELRAIVTCLGGELGRLLGIDLMVEALAAVVRLDPALVDDDWMSRHELRLVQSLKHQGWNAGTTSSSTSSSGQGGGHIRASGQRTEGRHGDQQRNKPGAGKTRIGTRDSSKPSHVSTMQSLKAAVAAGLSPAVARQLLDLYAACSHDMKDAALRQLCQQLVSLAP